ncbi:MAG: helix-turn-helix transcriptional regulator [Microthrixaceae bacterium]|nr:helix-turn-helix transcriptional regulator [Microthrixaceae bacterium]
MDTVGTLLRTWRGHRRLSQLELAGIAEVSQRHLSCVETGRSKPSRDLIRHLSRVLEVPPRHRNELLNAAGFASEYHETPLDDEAMTSVRRAVELMLSSHNPLPAVLLNRYWDLLDVNDGALRLLDRLHVDSEAIMSGTPNIQELTFGDAGFGGYLANRNQLAAAFLEHSRQEARLDPADERVAGHVEFLEGIVGAGGPIDHGTGAVIPVHLRTPDGDLRLFSTLASVATPGDLTTRDLMVELFFAADDATDRWLRS